MVRFYPHRQTKRMRLEKYREAWHLMQPDLPTSKSDVIPNRSWR
jgi:hypothetical protein